MDTVWTTSQSPGCGREKVTESVEGGRNAAANRTPGYGGMKPGAAAVHRRAPSGTRPGAPSAMWERLAQPFLMRFVSSVTWL